MKTIKIELCDGNIMYFSVHTWKIAKGKLNYEHKVGNKIFSAFIPMYRVKKVMETNLYTADSSGKFIEECSSFVNGLEKIRRYEEVDMKNDKYKRDSYCVVDRDHNIVP